MSLRVGGHPDPYGSRDNLPLYINRLNISYDSHATAEDLQYTFTKTDNVGIKIYIDGMPVKAVKTGTLHSIIALAMYIGKYTGKVVVIKYRIGVMLYKITAYKTSNSSSKDYPILTITKTPEDNSSSDDSVSDTWEDIEDDSNGNYNTNDEYSELNSITSNSQSFSPSIGALLTEDYRGEYQDASWNGSYNGDVQPYYEIDYSWLQGPGKYEDPIASIAEEQYNTAVQGYSEMDASTLHGTTNEYSIGEQTVIGYDTSVYDDCIIGFNAAQSSSSSSNIYGIDSDGNLYISTYSGNNYVWESVDSWGVNSAWANWSYAVGSVLAAEYNGSSKWGTYSKVDYVNGSAVVSTDVNAAIYGLSVEAQIAQFWSDLDADEGIVDPTVDPEVLSIEEAIEQFWSDLDEDEGYSESEDSFYYADEESVEDAISSFWDNLDEDEGYSSDSGDDDDSYDDSDDDDSYSVEDAISDAWDSLDADEGYSSDW